MAGVEISPMPRPIITICGTITRRRTASSTVEVEIHRNAAPKSTIPVVTTILVPIRGASAAPTTEATAIDSATGRIRAPVDSAPYPRTNWKYCVTRKMKPNSAKNVTVTAPLAALKRRSRNSETSSIGCGVRRSRTTNAASSTAAAANPPTVADRRPAAGRRLDDRVGQR